MSWCELPDCHAEATEIRWLTDPGMALMLCGEHAEASKNEPQRLGDLLARDN